MFLLVAFVCLAMGTNNIYSAITMSNEFMGTKIGLFVTGFALLVFFVLCAVQASKDIKEKKNNPDNNHKPDRL